MSDEAGRVLRLRRAAAGLTQQQVADRAGMSLRTLRDLEQGRVRRPRPRSVQRLSAALGLSSEDRAALEKPGEGPAEYRTGRLWLGVLGPLAIRIDGADVPLTAQKPRLLLSLLALSAPDPVTIEEAVEALWEQPPRTCLNLVTGYVAGLRRLLESARAPHEPAAVLIRQHGGYQLRCTAGQLDRLRFGALTDRARRAQADGQAELAMRLYGQALDCWRGTLLQDIDAAMRQRPPAAALTRQRIEATLERAALQRAAGVAPAAVRPLHDLAATEPFHEGLHAELMLALAAGGQQAAALTVYEDIRQRLSRELGVEPGRELRAAHTHLLRQRKADEPAAGGASPEAAGEPPPSRAVVPAQLPLDVADFVGRRRQLADLGTALPARDDATAPVIWVIHGTAGAGKTSLAVHWAHLQRDHFPDGQLYVNLRGFDPVAPPMDPGDAVRGFLDALEVPVHRIPADPGALFALYRSLLASRRILVVLDNARGASQIRPLLPGGPGCVVLITSRDPLTGLLTTEHARSVKVDLLSAREARQFLSRRLGRARTLREPAAVDEVITSCARLPLALAIAAARASTDPAMPLEALAADLTALDALDGGDPASDLQTAFASSYRALTPEAARLFRLLGLHPAPELTTAAAASLAGLPAGQAGQLLAELGRAHLVERCAAGRFSLHDLLHAYAHKLANSDETPAGCEYAQRRMISHYLSTASHADGLLNPSRPRLEMASPAPGFSPLPLHNRAEAVDWFHHTYQVLTALLRDSQRIGQFRQTIQLAYTLTTFFQLYGLWQQEVDSQRLAIEAAGLLHDIPARAVAHRAIARAHIQLGNLEEADRYLDGAVRLYRDCADESGEADARLDFAWLCSLRNRNADALDEAQHALQLSAKTPYAVGRPYALNAVGWYLARVGRYREAVTHCAEAVRLHAGNGDGRGEAETHDSLGYIHQHLGDHTEATAHYRHAMRIYEELGDRHGQADTLIHLGEASQAEGNAAAAGQHWARALSILTALNHPMAEQVRLKIEQLA